MIFIYFPAHLNFSYPSCSSTNSYLSFMPKFSSDWSIPIASTVSWTSLANFLSYYLSETALTGQRILSCQACSLSQSSLPVVSFNIAEGFFYFLSFFFFSLNLYSRFLAVIQIRVLLFLEVLPSVGLSWLFQLFFPWLSLASSYPGPCVSQPFFICFSVILSSVNWLFLINLVSTLVWWFNSSPQLLECHLCVSSQRTPSFVWPTVTSKFSFKFLKQWGDSFDCVVNGPK